MLACAPRLVEGPLTGAAPARPTACLQEANLQLVCGADHMPRECALMSQQTCRPPLDPLLLEPAATLGSGQGSQVTWAVSCSSGGPRQRLQNKRARSFQARKTHLCLVVPACVHCARLL